MTIDKITFFQLSEATAEFPVPYQFNRSQIMLKKVSVPVPVNLDEVEQLLCRMRELQRTIAAINGERDTEIKQLETDLAALKLKHDEQRHTAETVALDKAKPFQEELNQIAASIQLFATEHRIEILPKDRKSKKLKNGTIGWKLRQPFVDLGEKAKEKERAIIAWLISKGEAMRDFLRPKYELNREAILEKRPTIPGLRIEEGGEDFIVQVISDTPKSKEKFEAVTLPA